MTTHAQRFWPAIIIISALVVTMTELQDVQYAVRPWLAFGFILVCPGMALVRLLRIEGAVMELILAIAVSLLLAIFVATATVYAGVWSPGASLAILAAISIVGAGLQLLHTQHTLTRNTRP